MTTIAWDGKTLASDRLQSWGGRPISKSKIFRIKHKLYKAVGVCGNAVGSYAMLEKLLGKRKELPTLDVDDYNLLLIDKENKAWWLNGNEVPLEVPSPWALGTGGEYALGAMGFGATAEEAVHVAMKYDINTGIGVDKIEL